MMLTSTGSSKQARFGGLESPLSNYENARVAILPVPYDGTTSYLSGSRAGPAAILSASCNMELFDEELFFDPSEVGITTLPAVEVDARGPEWMNTAIRTNALVPIRDGKFLITLGGEHSITVGCLDAQLETHGEVDVLQIDAHADLRDEYQQSPYSHACVMRRVREKSKAVQVGIRSCSQEEHDHIKKNNLELFTMNLIRQNPDWVEQVIERLGPRVYVSIDLDGLDPSVCPGVGTPEPGGLSWHQVTGLMREVFKRREVTGADIVECLPIAGQVVSEYLAARLAYKLIAYRFAP
jgi:agmatinase